MVFRFSAVLLASIALLTAGPALAQSTATIVAEPSTAGVTPPEPLKPLDILDTEYPLESTLQSEKGSVEVALSIDRNGKVTKGEVRRSSGYPGLDAKTIGIARRRWAFRPATQDGMAVEGTVVVAADWKVPYTRVRDYDIHPVLTAGAEPPSLGGPVRETNGNDYPADALRFNKQGLVAVRYTLKADGSPGTPEVASTSGVPVLDNAALALVKNKAKYRPATLNGTPVDTSTGWIVVFGLEPAVSEKRSMRCFERPLTADHSESLIGRVFKAQIAINRLPKKGETFTIPDQPREERLSLQRWVHVAKSGAVTDVLFATGDGFGRPTEPIMEIAKKWTGYRKPATDAGCWYFDPIIFPKRQGS